MKTQRKIVIPVLVISILLVSGMMIFPGLVSAAAAKCHDRLAGNTYTCPVKPATGTKIDGKTGGTFAADKCYMFREVDKGWETSDCKLDVFAQVIDGRPIQPKDDPASQECTGDKCDLVVRVLNPIINFLAAAVGLIVTIVIVIGGIQYSASADDPQKVAAAKGHIINAVLGLLGFMFVWAFLQWLIPGGVF